MTDIPVEPTRDLVAQLVEATDADQVVAILDNYTKTLAAMIAAADAAPVANAPTPQKPPYHVPGPYEIALAVGAALAASGAYPTPGAALVAAWMAVPEFYTGRDAYLRELAPVMFGMSPAEGAAHDETH